jgi:hypothetical protein
MGAGGDAWDRSRASIVVPLGLLVLATGCTPTLNVAGVYFPGWLVSTVAGVVLAYGIVIVLSRRPRTKELADSGVFFVSLVASIALSAWWMFFSGF